MNQIQFIRRDTKALLTGITIGRGTQDFYFNNLDAFLEAVKDDDHVTCHYSDQSMTFQRWSIEY